MEKITLPARLVNLEQMLEFINKGATDLGFDDKKKNQIRLASEETLVNIINYAYPDKTGDIEITYTSKEGKELEVQIADWGVSFNPLTTKEPDISAPLEKRKVGGLGIYMLRKIMDKVDYKRQENRNILTFTKNL
jgi:anti-sigma regulatory factor (Ser/Thr protein kinase)